MKFRTLLCLLPLASTLLAQTTSQLLCIDDLKVTEIPIRQPLGCEIVDCCPGCPGSLSLDWRMHLDGNVAQPIQLEFRGLSAAEAKNLKVQGSAKFLADGSLEIQKGDTLLRGLKFDPKSRSQTIATGRILVGDALKTFTTQASRTEAAKKQDEGKIEFSIQQMAGQIAVHEMRQTIDLRACKRLGGGSGSGSGGSGSSGSGSGPKPSPTAAAVIGEAGSDNFHLFAALPDGMGRLQWTPATGWGSRWAIYTDVDAAANRWLGWLVPASWYDSSSVTGGSAGLTRGPQMQAYMAYWDPHNAPNVENVLLAQPSWFTDLSGFQWLYQWSSATPPAANQDFQQGFWPMSAVSWTAPQHWHVNVFGLDDHWGIPFNRRRSLREYRGADDQAWTFIDHGRPSSARSNPDNLNMGPQSTALNPLDHSAWAFVRSATIQFRLNSNPEVWYRSVQPGQSGTWNSLGNPLPASPRGPQGVEMSPPVAVSRIEDGLFKVNVFVFVLSATGHGQPGTTLQWELWERFFDGNQWQPWTPHGMIPGETPNVITSTFDDVPPFFFTTGLVWHADNTLRINLFGIASPLNSSTFGIPTGKIIEFFWDGSTWKYGAVRDGPNGGPFYIHSSFVFSSANRTHIGVIGFSNGQIWEMSWENTHDWLFERLYPR